MGSLGDGEGGGGGGWLGVGEGGGQGFAQDWSLQVGPGLSGGVDPRVGGPISSRAVVDPCWAGPAVSPCA